MSYLEAWNAIAARIRALSDSAHLYAQFLISHNSDSYGAGKNLADQCADILATIRDFSDAYGAILPTYAAGPLGAFLAGHPAAVIGATGTAREGKASILFLLAFESEMSFLLSGRQEQIRARSERAFLHLQRLLAVDEDLRAKWVAAFNGAGETSCEKLGALHLLWHGIFAFKIDASGARTDIVFQERVEQTIGIRGIDGVVLTEWKLADEANAKSRFVEARTQAELYGQGPLAGIELTSYRYIVVVSLIDLPKHLVPSDLDVKGIIYRHINIAIQPRLPSKQARSQPKQPK
jgi:hypothetical protein